MTSLNTVGQHSHARTHERTLVCANGAGFLDTSVLTVENFYRVSKYVYYQEEIVGLI